MFDCSTKARVKRKAKWPNRVCKKGFGNNLIVCRSLQEMDQ